MADFNEIKDKVLASLGKAADSAKDLTEKAADSVKAGGRIAKLSMEISSEKDSMKKTYLEIGKLYYETHSNDPEGFFIQLCEEISIAKQNIAEKEAEIETIKASKKEDDCDADIEIEFEEIVEEYEDAIEDLEDRVDEIKEAQKDDNE